jgi:hypothetical protein
MAERFQRPILLPAVVALALTAITAPAAADDPNAPDRPDANGLIVHLHRIALDRKPTPGQLAAGRGLLDRSAGYETLLIGLIDSKAYRQRKRSDAQFVTDAFRLALGRRPTREEARTFRDKLQDGTSRLVQLMTLMATAEYKKTKTQRLAGHIEQTDSREQASDSTEQQEDRPKVESSKKPDSKQKSKPEAKTKAEAQSKSGSDARQPSKTPAVTEKDLAAARRKMQAAWRKLASLVRNPKIALNDPKLTAARQAYFDARTRHNKLKQALSSQKPQPDSRKKKNKPDRRQPESKGASE